MRSVSTKNPSVSSLLLDYLWPGYRPVDVRREDGILVIRLQTRKKQAVCAHCGKLCFKRHGAQLRRAVDAPLYPHQRTIIEYEAHRYRCSCGHTCTECPEFIEPRAKVTKNMVLYTQQLLRCAGLTISAVGELTGLSWKTLHGLDKAQLKYCYETLDLSDVRNIAIDEFSVHKNHRYATVVLDNDTCRVLWVGRGKSKACVQPFFDKLKEQGLCGNIRSVACDQNAAYPSLVRENLPNATIVYDFFHVLANWRRLVLSEAKKSTQQALAEQLRAQAEQKAKEQNSRLDRKHLKDSVKQAVRGLTGIDWMMVRPQDEPDSKKRRERLLETLQKDNALLAALYPITESLRRLWKTKDPEQSYRLLKTIASLLLQINRTYNFKPAKSFALMLKRRSDGIVKAGQYGYSTNRLEGVNNRIKVLKRTAYGYRDMEYFGLKIKSMLPGRYVPSMYERLDGAAIIKNQTWSGPWRGNLENRCFHAQV